MAILGKCRCVRGFKFCGGIFNVHISNIAGNIIKAIGLNVDIPMAKEALMRLIN